MASQSSLRSPLVAPEERKIIFRWRLLFIGLAFLLPAAALVVAWATEAVEAIHGRAETWRDLALLPVLAVMVNWPFFVFAATVRRKVVRSWPDARSARLALAGALVGLLIPYLLLWAELTQEFILNAAYPAGAGASLVGPPMAWVAGPILGYVGAKIGPRIFRRRR